jgi:Uma2 family endonuclease
MATVERQVGARLRLWNKREYYRLGELGFFRGQRVELLEGRIVVLSPQNAPHTLAVDRVFRTLSRFFGAGWWVRPQFPLDLGQTTEPEPDVSVVLGEPDQFPTSHPTTAALIVEISDTTLSGDRHRKGSLYARAGIADYWIVNLVAGQLEVYRAPIPDARRRYGHRYSSRTDLLAAATVSPLALPHAVIPVADLLPAPAAPTVP